MRTFLTLLILALLLKAQPAGAQHSSPKVEKQPQWVTDVAADYHATHLDADAEDGYANLLYSRQVSVARQTVFNKKTMRVLSDAGVQNVSDISIDFDPSYEELIFHTVRIIRGAEILNRLNVSALKLLQREKELDRSIYDGSLSAVLILDDVRKGDVIEYSYSVKGFNPALNNKYTGVFDTRFGVPVYRVHYKLLHPTGRPLTVKNSGTLVTPQTSATATEKVYEWDIPNSAPVQTEDGIPSWYDAYPMIMASEFGSWSEVASWAAGLYTFREPPSPELQQLVADIKKGYPTQAAQVVAALRFVQDKIRYMGIEAGASSFRPHAPAQVIRQRFGDCKDKAYLLCTVLKALGVTAYPVLINTGYKKTITGWLPSPKAFDHVTVCCLVGGKTYYFDPTLSYQRGGLNDVAYPDYQVGLVVSPATTDFSVIPLQDKGRVQTKEVFDVDGYDGVARLKVTTMFSGSFADAARESFHTSSAREMKNSYRDLYTGTFKKIETDSLTFSDDEETGVFTTHEQYTIGDFWEKDKGDVRVWLQPFLINTVLRKPKDAKREMPYALSFPSRYEEEVEIHLPENWSIEESEHDYSTADAHLSYSYSLPKPDMVLLTYKWETLKDFVSLSNTDAYVRSLANAEANLSYELTKGHAAPSALSNGEPVSGFTVAYMVLGLCALFTFLYRRTKGYS